MNFYRVVAIASVTSVSTVAFALLGIKIAEKRIDSKKNPFRRRCHGHIDNIDLCIIYSSPVIGFIIPIILDLLYNRK